MGHTLTWAQVKSFFAHHPKALAFANALEQSVGAEPVAVSPGPTGAVVQWGTGPVRFLATSDGFCEVT